MQLTPAREIDYRSLRLLMERSVSSPMKKALRLKKFEKAYRRGEVFIPPEEQEVQKWWRCEARMMLGDYSDWRGWEFRDGWAAHLWFNKPYPVKPWNGLRCRKLYVLGEQGVGDEVIFASCLPECLKRCDEVILECEPRLRGVFERSFAGLKTVPAVIDREKLKRLKLDLPEGVDAWIPLGDLPRMWRLSLDHFPGTPYLLPAPPQVERFKGYRGRVGVSWRGAQGVVEEIREIPGALSLQYDRAWDEEVEEPEGLDLRNDLEGLFGLLANLSKVVTVSTSVAHFACALGVTTDVVIADRSTGIRGNTLPFKWLCKATPHRTPWYACARTYDGWKEYRWSA